MLNKLPVKQTLVAILLVAGPALGDPPAAHVPAVRGFHDWRLDCTAAPCALRTTVTGSDGSEVLAVSLAGPQVTLATRLPLYLPDGVGLAIEGMTGRQLPWWTCGAEGCEARLPLDPELAEALRRQRTGSATLTLLDGVPVRIGFSLVGFQAAARARDAVSPP
jgi:invasion protein IalB